jgi:flavin-dependent dehydrogenase
MWSAKIAAEVIGKALDSHFSQDELMTFDTKWRMQIADHLRSPHTDIRFLLPLIFTNQAMADRMAAAFFFGENI